MAKKRNRLEQFIADRDFSIENLLVRAKLNGANEFLVYEVLNYRGEPMYISGETRPGAATYDGQDHDDALSFASGYIAGFRAASSK